MTRDIVYFDLETQRTANDAGGWDKKRDMFMSIGVTYSTRTGEYQIYPESRVQELIEQLLKADLVVGFNVINFDEFVFIPGGPEEDFAHRDFYREMLSYYFFAPQPRRLMRAWRNDPDTAQVGGGNRFHRSTLSSSSRCRYWP